jgi:DNA-binding LacI/PurR family transcriptional regulator
MGRIAAQVLTEMMDPGRGGRPTRPHHYVLPTQLVVRGTTASREAEPSPARLKTATAE